MTAEDSEKAWKAFFNDPPEGGDPDQVVEKTLGELKDLRAQARLEGLRAGLIAARGTELGTAAYLDLNNAVQVPNTVLCPNYSRATTSKWLQQVRRNLGRPPRCPDKARPGHQKGWKEKVMPKAT